MKPTLKSLNIGEFLTFSVTRSQISVSKNDTGQCHSELFFNFKFKLIA